MPLTAAADGGAIEAHAEPGLVIGAKLGLGTGAPVSEYGPHYALELELGYLLPLPAPFLHALELFASAGYSNARDKQRTTAPDARLPGDGVAHFTLDQSLFALSAGVLGRLPIASERFAPYLAAGYRGYLVTDSARGRAAGRNFGDYTATSLAHGFFATAGLDVFLGPGALLAELQFAYARYEPRWLDSANVGGLQFMLGYRLMLGGPSAKPAQVPAKPQARPPESKPEAHVETPVEDQSSEPEPPPPTAAEQAQPNETPALRGQIRGFVRSLEGKPLQAAVLVQPGDMRTATAPDGTFSLDVAPGEFSVQLRARGYKTQTRSVVVDEDGITVLNVELTKE